MYFGMCVYESLSEDGLLETVLVTPSEDSMLVADRLSDVGVHLSSDVDIGPLRFYTDECGLSARTTAARLSQPRFLKREGEIVFSIDHLHWPLRPVHAGYFILLLPEGFGGTISCSKSHEIVFMTDRGQILVSAMIYPDEPSVSVSGTLNRDSGPPDNAERSTEKEVFGGTLPGIYYTPVGNLLKALRHNLVGSPSAFLCHSSSDKVAARRLAIQLATRGIRPWIDEAEIRVGDSLIQKIEEGIQTSTCIVPVLSKSSVGSRWCQEELRMALARQIQAGVKGVLPVLIEECSVPGFLLEKAHADLRDADSYDEKVDRLAADIRELSNAALSGTPADLAHHERPSSQTGQGAPTRQPGKLGALLRRLTGK